MVVMLSQVQQLHMFYIAYLSRKSNQMVRTRPYLQVDTDLVWFETFS